MALTGKFYGENKHVYLKPEEYDNLVERYGEDYVVDVIKRMDEYCDLTGRRYKRYVLAINRWAKKDAVKLNGLKVEAEKRRKALSEYERYKLENGIE